jgi:glycosyltransferase involved in cell wall biosynthesis
MAAIHDPIERFERALASPDLALLEGSADELGRTYPSHPIAHFARAELLRRKGDLTAALSQSARSLLAIPELQRFCPGMRVEIGALLRAIMAYPDNVVAPMVPYLEQFGALAETQGIPQQLASSLSALLAHVTDPAQAGRIGPQHALATIKLLGFRRQCGEAWADRLFAELVVPWMVGAAKLRQFDVAIVLEGQAYDDHTKRAESQQRFKATVGHWVPQLSAAVREAHGQVWAPHTHWRPEPKRRVALFVYTASMLAHVAVLIETLTAVARVGMGPYEFTVFVLGAKHAGMHDAFTKAGVHVRYLEEACPGGSLFQRLQALQQILRQENFAMCWWISLIVMMAVAYPLRLAPLQGWWAMKYHACDIPEIDAHLAMENVVTQKRMDGVDWRTLGTASLDWLGPRRPDEAQALRARYPEDAIIAASIGREEKLDSPDFVNAIAALLKRHRNLVFLWTGRVQLPSIQSVFEREGVAERTHFVGWVDTKLYAQAIDLFLDSFPFPCGFTLKEAMAAGKGAVMFRSEESLETGVPGAITPVLEKTSSAPASTYDTLKSVFSDARDFDLYFCASSPEEYVEMASRLIDDAELRKRAGQANQRFIETFLSSPEAEARKLLDHLDQLFESIPVTP